MYNKNRNTSTSITEITTKYKEAIMAKETEEKAGFSTETPAKSTKKKQKISILSVIIGLYAATLIVSMSWGVYIVGMGTDWAKSSIIMLSPMMLFIVLAIGGAFVLASSKIFK
jgi:hypothetical protein